jgi:hypothetical protein
VTGLEQLPARIDDLTSQISQFRTEVRGEFSAVRSEIRDLGVQMRVLYEDLLTRITQMQEGRRSRSKRKPQAD